MRVVAQIISYVFHPLMMPIAGTIILFNTHSYINYALSPELKRAVLILVGTNTLAMPLLVALLLLNRKWIGSLAMETRKERTIPYAITIVFYVVALFLLKQAPVPSVLLHFLIGTTLSVFVALVVNSRWKISAHAIGIGGIVGVLLFVSILLEIYITPYLVIALLAAGLVGTSRLILNSHTPNQVYAGFLIGLLCQFITAFF